ncbi:MAG: hypothetical protein ACXWCZ_14370, partial [Flavisolibacter sp.]
MVQRPGLAAGWYFALRSVRTEVDRNSIVEDIFFCWVYFIDGTTVDQRYGDEYIFFSQPCGKPHVGYSVSYFYSLSNKAMYFLTWFTRLFLIPIVFNKSTKLQ